MYTTIEQARDALSLAAKDVEADMGPEVVDEGWADIVGCVLLDCTPEVAKELKRQEGLL